MLEDKVQNALLVMKMGYFFNWMIEIKCTVPISMYKQKNSVFFILKEKKKDKLEAKIQNAMPWKGFLHAGVTFLDSSLIEALFNVAYIISSRIKSNKTPRKCHFLTLPPSPFSLQCSIDPIYLYYFNFTVGCNWV